MHIYADWEITCTLSKMHSPGPGRETSLCLAAQGMGAGTHRWCRPACGDPLSWFEGPWHPHAFPLPTQPPPMSPWEEEGRNPVTLLHRAPWWGMLAAMAIRCKQQEEPNLGSTWFAASGEPAAFPTFREIHIRPRLFAAILWPGPIAGLQRQEMCWVFWGFPRAQQVEDMRFLFIYYSLARKATI